jgi:putative intracellular protease/amidase
MTSTRSSTRHIGLLLFDDVEELDAVGPWEVLSSWTPHHPEDGWSISRRPSTYSSIPAATAPGSSCGTRSTSPGSAGLLAGRPVTTHRESLDLLQELDPSIEVDRDARYVDDGSVLVARLATVDRAREVRRHPARPPDSRLRRGTPRSLGEGDPP